MTPGIVCDFFDGHVCHGPSGSWCARVNNPGKTGQILSFFVPTPGGRYGGCGWAASGIPTPGRVSSPGGVEFLFALRFFHSTVSAPCRIP